MSTNVEANGRSILHKGHGQTHTCAVPDVCKTPSPGGPVPIPYINIATDSNITSAAESVKIEGNPAANVGAKIATSTGDEAGSAGGGIMSSKIKGTVTWQMGSLDVKAEGKSVVRFMDPAFHNGNSFNTSFLDNGGLGMGYADDFDGYCPICQRAPAEHAIRSTGSTAMICGEIIRLLREGYAANMSPTRVLARGETRDDIAKRRGKQRKGYMVGVMICVHARDQGRTKSNTFAAMSGDTTPGFERVVNSSGLATLVGGGAVGPEDMIAANTRAGVNEAALRTNVMAAYNRIVAARTHTPNGRPQPPGYTDYGTCAAAKLLAASGHGPIQMTEAWFQPTDSAGPQTLGPYWMRVNGRRIRAREYPATDAQIPSCNSCQESLYMTMCPVRVCRGRN
jgi:Toxin PAAR-like domain